MTSQTCTDCTYFTSPDRIPPHCTISAEVIAEDDEHPTGAVVFAKTTADESCDQFKQRRNPYCRPVGRS